MKLAIGSLVIVAALGAVSYGSLSLLAQDAPAEQQVSSEVDRCFKERGALAAGIAAAMTYSARGQHDRAQQTALDALSVAGYRCAWVPDDAMDEARVRMRCDHGGE